MYAVSVDSENFLASPFSTEYVGTWLLGSSVSSVGSWFMVGMGLGA
jgi:hypothetical protein